MAAALFAQQRPAPSPVHLLRGVVFSADAATPLRHARVEVSAATLTIELDLIRRAP